MPYVVFFSGNLMVAENVNIRITVGTKKSVPYRLLKKFNVCHLTGELTPFTIIHCKEHRKVLNKFTHTQYKRKIYTQTPYVKH
jgi:hypothetical protein